MAIFFSAAIACRSRKLDDLGGAISTAQYGVIASREFPSACGLGCGPTDLKIVGRPRAEKPNRRRQRVTLHRNT